jgi:hypothetical protein
MSGSQPTVSKAMHKTPAMKDHSVLLGDLHADKVYLEKLLQNPGSHFHTLSALISFPVAGQWPGLRILCVSVHFFQLVTNKFFYSKTSANELAADGTES